MCGGNLDWRLWIKTHEMLVFERWVGGQGLGNDLEQLAAECATEAQGGMLGHSWGLQEGMKAHGLEAVVAGELGPWEGLEMMGQGERGQEE